MLRIIAIPFLIIAVNLSAQVHPLLDPTFGNNGKVSVNIDSVDHCETVLNDDQGNTYFLGYTESSGLNGLPDRDYIIGKLDPSGQIDPSFGYGGIMRGDFTGYAYSEITDAAISSDAIYFCGNGGTYNNLDTQSAYVGKMFLDGTMDSTFGVNGYYSDEYSSKYNDIRSIHLLPDNRLLVAGVTFDSVVIHREIAFFGRLTEFGERDSSFGTTGILTWNAINGLQNGFHTQGQSRHIDGSVVNDITVSPWGTYFLTGYFDLGNTFSVFTASFDTVGNYDVPYNQGGILIYDFNPTLRQNGIVSMPYLGRMVIGLVPGNEGDFVIQSIDSTGLLGTVQIHDMFGNHDRIEDMMITELGELYFCGQSRLATNSAPGYTSDYFTAFRFSYNQMQVDSSFTDTVFFMESFNGFDESGSFSMSESDFGITLGGFLNNIGPGNHSDIGLMRIFKDDTNVVALDKISSQSAIFYPNPTTGSIYFKGITKEATILIHDLYGRCLRNETDSEKLELSHLVDGIYLITIIQNNQQSTERVILRR